LENIAVDVVAAVVVLVLLVGDGGTPAALAGGGGVLDVVLVGAGDGVPAPAVWLWRIGHLDTGVALMILPDRCLLHF